MFWYYKQATHRRPGDEPFLGSTVYDWGWPKNCPFWTENGRTWQACQRSKVVQKGPKGIKMVNLSVFDHLGPFWAPLGPFGPFQTKIDFLLRSTSVKPYFIHLGQKLKLRNCDTLYVFQFLHQQKLTSKSETNIFLWR